ncbi:methylamine utilization protein MauJ [Peribacillus frigoritolerans]|uniref:methylamine utilization protein MauJ n=1 Tax=Peribacillus frigoritolerans TaxID=450367 RepID=UPI0020BF5D71|nr:methylamine utilization protein MauJ [Peribacillus frigoritolerans]
MNYVEYYTVVEGVNPSILKVKYTNNLINGIDIKIYNDEELDPTKCKLEIKFIVSNNVTSVEDALKTTLDTAHDIINLLSFNTEGKFGIPRRGRFNINGQGVVAIAQKPLYNLQNNEDLSQGLSNRLELSLSNNNLLADLKNNSYHRLYRAAMRTNDIIARFMFLYGIIFDIKTTQNLVDDYIQSIDPNVEMRKSTDPRKPNKDITKYTWLRNEIGHTRNVTDINKVKNEITEVCDGFAELVKGAI